MANDAPESPRQISFGALVREHILPYNTLFAISGVLAFLLGLISSALVIAFGAVLLSLAVVLVAVNHAGKEAMVRWANDGRSPGRADKRFVRLIWPAAASSLRTSGVFWVIVVVGVAVTLYGTTGAFEKRRDAARAIGATAQTPESTQKRPPRVLILPFKLEAGPGDGKAALLAGGVTDDIIAGLSRFDSVRVLGRNTSAAFPAGADHKTIRDKLAVEYLVSGGFRIVGDEFRLTVEVAETATGATVWSDRLAGPLPEVINLGENVVRQIVGRVASQIMGAELQESRKSNSATMSAYELKLQARQLWRKPTSETLPKAQALLRKAIELDPTYAPAYVYLAFTYLTSYNNSWADGFSRPETLSSMLALASKAIELEPLNATAHSAQAIAYTYQGRHAEALAVARHALKLNGSEAEILARAAQVLSFAGEHRAAIDVLQRAFELDPLGPAQLLNFLSRAYFFAPSSSRVNAWSGRVSSPAGKLSRPHWH